MRMIWIAVREIKQCLTMALQRTADQHWRLTMMGNLNLNIASRAHGPAVAELGR